MAERVRRDPSALKRWTRRNRTAHCSGEAETDTGPGNRSTPSVGKQRLVHPELVASIPLVKHPSRLRPQRNRAVFPALAVQLENLSVDIADAQRDHLGDAGAGVVKEGKQKAIATAAPRSAIAGFQDGIYLVAGEETQQRLRCSLQRNRQDPLTDLDKLWIGVGQRKAGKAPKSGEPDIARADAIAALPFKVVKKPQHVFRRERGEIKLVDRSPQEAGEKWKKQAEGVAVGGHRLGTDVALGSKMFGEETLHERGERD